MAEKADQFDTFILHAFSNKKKNIFPFKFNYNFTTSVCSSEQNIIYTCQIVLEIPRDTLDLFFFF